MFAVIMAGGSGTRFWPASRRSMPKQFLDITGKGPMLVETCNRLKPLVRDDQMVVVLGAPHEARARSLLGDRPIRLVAEPVGRNTAPCIGLGAIIAKSMGCEDAVAFLPADHFIAEPERFLDDLEEAGRAALDGGIVTLGIVPTRPETGYGYSHAPGDGKDSSRILAVDRFVEKPDLDTARTYMASGEYYWNAGIFVATPDTILREIREHLPELSRGLEEVAEALDEKHFEAVLSGVYHRLQGVSFDYGVMEKTRGPVRVIPSRCGWSDVGSWMGLYELLDDRRDLNGNLARGEALLEDCRGVLVSGGSGRLVACLGLQDCLVVETRDAVLVADLRKSQGVRKIVQRLEREGKEKWL